MKNKMEKPNFIEVGLPSIDPNLFIADPEMKIIKVSLKDLKEKYPEPKFISHYWGRCKIKNKYIKMLLRGLYNEK